MPQLLEQGASPGMPATLDGPISQHVSADPPQHPRRAGGIDVATLSPVCRVSTLVLCNGGGVLAFDVQRLTQAFEHLTGRNISQSLLERLTRSRCVTRAEGRPPLGDRRRAHQAMIARAGTPKLGYLLSLGSGVWITLRPRPARWQSSSSGWYSGYDLALGLRRRHRRRRPARQSNHRHDLTRGGCSAGTRGVLNPVASGSPSPSSPARTARPGCRTDLRQGSGCRPGPRQAAPGTSHLPARDHRLPLAGHRP